MISKTFEVNRKDEWLFLAPTINNNITSKFGLKNYEHIVQRKHTISTSNIIDLREEFKKNKTCGYLNMYLQFYDKSINLEENNKLYLEVPDDINLNPYLIDNVWLAPINRNLSRKNNKMLVYKYHDDENENEDEYICSHSPSINNEVYVADNNNPYYTSNYIFDSEYNMNLIHLGETFYLDYKNHLANEKNYFVTESISKNGWGFFEIGVRTPNSNYTPDYAELFVTWSEKSKIPIDTYNNNEIYQYAEAFIVDQ
jgi:hypothetical protein